MTYDGDIVLCSFDIKSLFTNVPVVETINICADAMFNKGLNTTNLSRDDFIKLMKFSTSDVEFSFNNTMFKQIDGISMGSPLGPTMANIFVGYYEAKLFTTVGRPLVYTRYVDDTFAVFPDTTQKENFEERLNNLHKCLKFTSEVENNDELPFLDVLVKKQDGSFSTRVYRKTTFTGEYTKWNSFCDRRRKVSLVSTLTHRALMICSNDHLEKELDAIKNIFSHNGYPSWLVSNTIDKKIKDFQACSEPVYGPKKCRVYIRLPYIGSSSDFYRKKISTTVSRCYGAVTPHVMFTSKPILRSSYKDSLPIHARSNLIYRFKCCCNSTYVGRTCQRLENRISQHVPKKIEKLLGLPTQQHSEQSAIAEHLLNNPQCGKEYNREKFSIIGHGRSLFHLQILEALNISTEMPVLCKQKKFVYSTILFKHLCNNN